MAASIEGSAGWMGGRNGLTETIDGRRLTVSYLVKGLTASGIDAKLIEARGVAGMPALGDAAPGDPNITVQTVSVPRLIDTDKAEVVIEYGPKNAEELASDTLGGSIVAYRVDSITERQVTYEDIGGTRMVVTYKNNVGLLQDVELAQAETTRPRLRISITEALASEPKATALNYVGRVNDATHGGRAENTLFIERLNYAQRERDGFWLLNWSILYSPDTWVFTHINTNGFGFPHADATTGTALFTGEPGGPNPGGIASFEVIPQATFAGTVPTW